MESFAREDLLLTYIPVGQTKLAHPHHGLASGIVTRIDSSGAQARHPHLLHAGDPENSRQSRNASALRRPTARPSVIVVRATKPEMVRTSCREAYVSDGMLFRRSRRRVERNWGMVIVLEETSRAIIL